MYAQQQHRVIREGRLRAPATVSNGYNCRGEQRENETGATEAREEASPASPEAKKRAEASIVRREILDTGDEPIIPVRGLNDRGRSILRNQLESLTKFRSRGGRKSRGELGFRRVKTLSPFEDFANV